MLSCRVIAERRAAARRVNGIDTHPKYVPQPSLAVWDARSFVYSRPRHPVEVFVTVEISAVHNTTPTGGPRLIPRPQCLSIISSSQRC